MNGGSRIKFSSVAHLYLGCQCVVSESEYYEAGQGKLVRVDIEDDETLTVSGNTMHDRTQYCVEADFDDVKPILRPLSSMTDEEKIELAKMHNSKIEWKIIDGKATGRENIGVVNIMEWEGDMFLVREINNNIFGQMSEGCISASNITSFELIRYLLSKGFDLFGLIESGEAISA